MDPPQYVSSRAAIPPVAKHKGATQRCENCRSKRLFTQDGRLWCRRCGSLQEDFIQTQQDDDFGTLRSSQVTRQKKEKQEKVKKSLSGTKALYLYLSAYQLILQHICRDLIDKKGLPVALEALVKDLWELRMKLIRERYIASRPYENEDEGSGTTLYSSQTETEYSRTEGGETTDGEADGRPAKVRREKDYPNIIDMLGLCYMACMILRVPLSIGDLYRWALREEIHYLRPLRLVPAEMQHRLPPRWLPLLQTRTRLQPSKLYAAVHDLHSLYSRNFSIYLPSLNYSPLLHHYIISLALPIDLFPAVTHLSSILPRCLAFPKPQRRTTFLTQPEIHLIVLLIMSIKLFRPFRPADLFLSQENTFSPLGEIPFDWKIWVEKQRTMGKQIHDVLAGPSQAFEPGDQADVDTMDVFSLSEKQLDSYMDWFENTWVDPVPRQTFHKQGTSAEDSVQEAAATGIMGEIISMFPTSRHAIHRSGTPFGQDQNDSRSEEDRDTAIRKVVETTIMQLQASACTASNSASEEISAQGETYIHYRYPSDLREEHSPARIFHERLAELAGLYLDDLLKATYKMERRLIRWWGKERRQRQDAFEPG